MAYQNVGTPIFYIDSLSWLEANGNTFKPNDAEWQATGNSFWGNVTRGFDPSKIWEMNTHHRDGTGDQWGAGDPWNLVIVWERADVAKLTGLDKLNLDFIAILGHNFQDAEMAVLVKWVDWDAGGTGGSQSRLHLGGTKINAGVGGTTWIPDYNGFTIAGLLYDWHMPTTTGYRLSQINIAIDGGVVADKTYKIGSLAMGETYQMPHSPELKLTMSREMDGVKRVRTRSGADLANHKYTKPAMWGEAAAWELWRDNLAPYELSRVGRRVWDLSFSYLQDSDVFPMVGSLFPYEYTSDTGQPYQSGQVNFDFSSEHTLLKSDNFFSKVIHRTLGAGNLPFVFQPDGNNSNTDQFAICKFDQKSFKIKQVANGVYNVKLKIREVW